MLTLEEQIARKCIHFNGVMEKVCKAGVNYDDVKVHKPFGLPCLQQGGECQYAKFPTEEEVKKKVSDIENGCLKTIVAMSAIKDHVAKTKEQSGKIKCQCGGDIHFTVAQLNGHVHAKCNSCDISFME